mmetsp:Transcript_37777/g.106755  ORF Transcript_37777/g.106755 Transcript_37777/m.106755 type:complete len:108 (-) Transcript_37777:474-797(-)
MVKKRKSKAGRNGSGMELDGGIGGEQSGWQTGPVADMDTSDGPKVRSTTISSTIPKHKSVRGQKHKVQKKRKKLKLEKALSRAEQQETRVTQQTAKDKKKVVLKSLY